MHAACSFVGLPYDVAPAPVGEHFDQLVLSGPRGCAITRRGKLECWADDADYDVNLGPGYRGTTRYEEVFVDDEGVCARKVRGGIDCWMTPDLLPVPTGADAARFPEWEAALKTAIVRVPYCTTSTSIGGVDLLGSTLTWNLPPSPCAIFYGTIDPIDPPMPGTVLYIDPGVRIDWQSGIGAVTVIERSLP